MEPVGFHVRLPLSTRGYEPEPTRDLRAHRFGPPVDSQRGEAAVPVLCVHGLSANARGFDPLGRHLATLSRSTIAVDLRGRGRSACTGAGTYGWRTHARDLLAVADSMKADRFDLVGHSMGAFVGMQLAAMAGVRIRRLALIDAVGMPEAAAMPPILRSVQRLSSAYPSFDAYVNVVRSLGTIEPWSDDWVNYFRYELEELPDGRVKPRTSSAAVLEDAFYGSTQDPRTFWGALTMPTLVVRANRPIGATPTQAGGFIVSTQDLLEFLRRVPGSRAEDVSANHYGVLMHQGTLDAIGSFLS
jgi:pimeloyl-ACP methyl ester carboxylesterase